MLSQRKFSINLPFCWQKDDNHAVFEIPLKQIDHTYLSIASREIRNRKAYYQKKHITGTEWTKDRSPNLSNLNLEIPKHFQSNFNISDIFEVQEPYVVIGIGDATANLFRLSYDTSKFPPLFFLDEEPYRQKEYYCFVSQKLNHQVSFQINKIVFRNDLPLNNNHPISNLEWLFCSTPLVWQSKIVDKTEMAINNYDLRHLFGKDSQQITNNIYKESVDQNMNFSYSFFTKAIKDRQMYIKTSGKDVEWYHAGIGLKEDALIILHNQGSIIDLANQFHKLGASDALLLDSGGSSVFWTNIKNQGRIAYQNDYHRPRRGALIILKLKSTF